MERLILEIIRNSGLISHIEVSEVFERAVALYNAQNNKSKAPAYYLDKFMKDIDA